MFHVKHSQASVRQKAGKEAEMSLPVQQQNDHCDGKQETNDGNDQCEGDPPQFTAQGVDLIFRIPKITLVQGAFFCRWCGRAVWKLSPPGALRQKAAPKGL